MFNQKGTNPIEFTNNLVRNECRHGTRKGRYLMEIGLAILAVWLAVLTVTREIQISTLRDSVNDLTMNLIALKTNMKYINNEITELKNLEDNLQTRNVKSSGLRSGDLGEPVMRFGEREGSGHPAFVIHQIKQLLNQNSENLDISNQVLPTPESDDEPLNKRRSKRSEGSQTEINDGTNSTTKNNTLNKNIILVNSSNVAITPVHLQLAQFGMCCMGLTRNIRDSEDKKDKPIAAHFPSENADGSDYNFRYTVPFNQWSKESLPTNQSMSPSINRYNNYVKINKGGLFLVYAQLYFDDVHDSVSWILMKRNRYVNHRLIQCIQSSWSPPTDQTTKTHTCFSLTLAELDTDDELYVVSGDGSRNVLVHKDKSFMGLVMVSRP